MGPMLGAMAMGISGCTCSCWVGLGSGGRGAGSGRAWKVGPGWGMPPASKDLPAQSGRICAHSDAQSSRDVSMLAEVERQQERACTGGRHGRLGSKFLGPGLLDRDGGVR